MTQHWNDEKVDAMLRHALHGRPEPSIPTSLAERAMTLARRQERAASAQAEQLATWLARRRWMHRSVAGLAAVLVAGVVLVGAWRVGGIIVDGRSSTLSSQGVGTSQVVATTDRVTDAAESQTLTSTQWSQGNQMMAIVGGMAVVALAAAAIGRAFSAGDASPFPVPVPSLR